MTTIKLYTLGRDELLNILRQHGVTSLNVSSATRIYESGDTIKAVIDSYKNPPKDQTGVGESVGFWVWMDTEENWEMYNKYGLEVSGRANLETLRRML